jgi:nicotinamide mononucleotide (NMN) deamidase PncC
VTAALVAVDPDGLARRTRLARDIGEALAKLAVHASPTDVALALETGGYAGRPGNADTCPVARYLTGTVDDVELGEVLVGLWTAGDCDQFGYAEVDLPEVIRGFVDRFDNGAYVELVRP